MVRNSLDHGIETVEDRLAAGKEVQGRIFLKSSVDNDNIVMRIWDDGRGLNLWKIRTKAGLGNDVAPVDIAKQVFSASFSTADKVSDISGRGVGLDAVQANVEKLGGSIQIDLTGLDHSAEYVAFAFEIVVPASLAHHDDSQARKVS